MHIVLTVYVKQSNPQIPWKLNIGTTGYLPDANVKIEKRIEIHSKWDDT